MENKTTAAKEIRKILKKEFPKIKFSVTSDYSKVSVRWENGPTNNSVESKISQFQMGHFNGMEDIYEYSNVNDLIPQVKYLFCQRSVSGQIKAKIQTQIAEDFGIKNQDDSIEWKTKTNMWADMNVWRKLENLDLTDYVI